MRSPAWLERLLGSALQGGPLDAADGSKLLASDEELLLEVVAAAARVRRRFFGARVKLSFLVNVKSGACPEDCAYCSQSRASTADVLKYPWIAPEDAAELAERAAAAGARRICLVAAGRRPSGRDLARAERTIEAIRGCRPELEVCVSLGFLREAEAERLRRAGAASYNHNLNTSPDRYGEICTTHSYADRVATATSVGRAGLSLCSGAIFGLGESDAEVVEIALALRELEPSSVPVNFLMPFEGTPLDGARGLSPRRCLRILALLRFAFPRTELRLAAGREIHLRTAQPLALQIADSIFLGDYLTSEGQAREDDLAMIRDAGLEVEDSAPPPAGDQPAVAPRRRGPGTGAAANL
ncbi:MAG: biotin synthase BioB [Solirubrobacterales bacterium]